MTSRTLRTLAALPLLLALSISASLAQKRGGGTPTKQDYGPLMWRAYGDSATIDLIGSVHLLPSSALPLPGVMTDAFDTADVLALEIALDQNAMAGATLSILSRATFGGDTTLRKVLSKKAYAELKKYARKQGLDLAALEGYRPWMVGFMIMGSKMMGGGEESEDGAMQPGVDMIAQERAQERGISTRGLETIDFQLGLFTDLSLKDQEAFLLQQIRGDDMSGASFEELVDTWKRGDSAALVRSIEKEYPAKSDGYNKLIVERNKAWIPQLEAWMHEPKHFVVVVGAAHLVGPDGVIAMLKSRGYRVERVAQK